jgi:hypothetical protein
LEKRRRLPSNLGADEKFAAFGFGSPHKPSNGFLLMPYGIRRNPFEYGEYSGGKNLLKHSSGELLAH